MKLWFRFVLVVALLGSAGLFLHAHSRPEVLPPRKELSGFPPQVGQWVGRDAELPANILEALGPGEFLSRTYHRADNQPFIDFFAGYFPSQRAGNTIHSPQNCLPGAGWTQLESSRLSVTLPGGKRITVNRYILAKGEARIVVLYWYQAHGRVVASEYWAKFYLVADAIRLNRTDGALVRVITPVAPGENFDTAQQRALGFALSLAPLLDDYIPL
jgi:EpsI family protein